MNRLTTLFGVLSTAMIFFSSCKKDTPYNLPSVPVNITLNINNPAYINLQHIGGWTYITGGVQGIILFRTNESTINAFDRLSPYQSEKNCILSVDSNNVYAVDACSGSKFLLSDGYPIQGPANLPMISYYTTFNGTMLTISN